MTSSFSRARAWCAAAAALVAVSASLTAAQAAPPTRLKATIVFNSDRAGTGLQIYRMDPDGGGPTRLTNNASHDFQPSLSPNGKKIAFARWQDLNWEIYTMNVDGTGQTRLTTNANYDTAPSWSPDGTKIAFTRGPATGDSRINSEIFTMNADGSGQVNRTNTIRHEFHPSWSPDGTKIVFDRGVSICCDFDLYTMNPDGSAQSFLAENGYDPAWSPDGSTIAFTGREDGGDANIYTIRSNGSGRTNLTNYTDTPGQDGAGGEQASWSPDATKIAFASTRDGLDEDTAEIYTMNADGSGQTRITTDLDHDDAYPSWGFRVVHGKPPSKSDCPDIKLC
jgi:Tol biopolymer transport system component